ncbi:MAG: DUF5671 domain-containing protein [Candidatus Peregrinibacteria bacterium]|nr:DUF5671 domain-containing protein [Candidatus Peregrinibacteria bacterium]
MAKSETNPLRTSPKDAFLNFLMLVMLYIGVISLITLAFAYIDYSFPDPLSFYRVSILDSIRFQSSMLIVSFPLLIFLSSVIQKDMRKTPAKHDLKFAKWLIYLTLFFAALAIVIDLVQLVNRFYSGELTTPFVLKVLTVLLVAGGVFGYFLWNVQGDPHKSKLPRTVAWASSGVVLVMLVLGFFIAGSPAEQREIRMDEERISDLSYIQNSIVNYYQLKRELPKSLEVLNDDLRGVRVPTDPETGEDYGYVVSGSLNFELCATFNKASLSSGSSREYAAYPVKYGMEEVWTHEEGRQCFSRTIDPELYPVR